MPDDISQENLGTEELTALNRPMLPLNSNEEVFHQATLLKARRCYCIFSIVSMAALKFVRSVSAVIATL